MAITARSIIYKSPWCYGNFAHDKMRLNGLIFFEFPRGLLLDVPSPCQDDSHDCEDDGVHERDQQGVLDVVIQRIAVANAFERDARGSGKHLRQLGMG